MSLTQKFDTMMANIDDRNEENIEQALTIYKETLHETLNVRGTPKNPSRPGEAPHKVKGQLQGSIFMRMDGLEGEVGTDAPHGKYLVGERNYIQIAWNRCKAQIHRLFSNS